MSCFLEKENSGEVKAVLTFNRSELLDDIKSYAYIEGHVMEADNDHRRHMVQDVGEEGNVDRVTRVLGLTVAKCREMLHSYTKHEILRPVLDDRLRETPVYGMVLSVPQDFSQTTLDLLEELIHEYLVCGALADWLGITNPAKAEAWALRAQNAREEIRACLNTRMTRSRIKLHPFL